MVVQEYKVQATKIMFYDDYIDQVSLVLKELEILVANVINKSM